MGVVVINIDKDVRPSGPHLYEVRLNQIPLASFVHIREDGMVVCMRKAAEALEGVDIDAKVAAWRQRQEADMWDAMAAAMNKAHLARAS